MDNIKDKIIEDIRSKHDVFKDVPPVRYRVRCPLCGDSDKDPRDAHFYILNPKDPHEPLQYKCFLCNKKGLMTPFILRKLGVDNRLIEGLGYHVNHRVSITTADLKIALGEPKLDSPQVRYIEERLGKGFTLEDYQKFKIIWNFDTINQYITNQRVKNTMPSNMDSISLLATSKEGFLCRSFDPNANWRKIRIIENDNPLLYTIGTSFDLFTKEMLTVNIAEGVFDILSVYKNFGTPNAAYIAVLGSDYMEGVNHAIRMGIIGDNVDLNIYIDDGIDIKFLKRQLKGIKWLFHKIRMFQNIKYKDVGVRIEEIKLLEISL